MFPISPVSFVIDEYLVTVWYHQWSTTYTKKVVALIQQTDADRISRDSLASLVFDVYWIGSNGVHVCVVFGALEPTSRVRWIMDRVGSWFGSAIFNKAFKPG